MWLELNEIAKENLGTKYNGMNQTNGSWKSTNWQEVVFK